MSFLLLASIAVKVWKIIKTLWKNFAVSTDLPIWFKPNAGLPEIGSDGRQLMTRAKRDGGTGTWPDKIRCADHRRMLRNISGAFTGDRLKAK